MKPPRKFKVPKRPAHTPSYQPSESQVYQTGREILATIILPATFVIGLATIPLSQHLGVHPIEHASATCCLCVGTIMLIGLCQG